MLTPMREGDVQTGFDRFIRELETVETEPDANRLCAPREPA
ncbi:MAG: hypothetical protein V3U52_04390 [Thermoplasmata archaeon]